jgi:uncharacterized repeat protein (TIGR01451 family)
MIRKNSWVFSLLLSCMLLGGLNGSLLAQIDNRVPFKHRVGNSAPEGNLFRVRGDFTIIGNTNLTLAVYNDTSNNSANEVVFVDVDQDSSTLNSSSATLMFSQENGADPSCTDILYAGLYWSGRAEMGKGMTFDFTKTDVPGTPLKIDKEIQTVKGWDQVNYTSYTLSIADQYDAENNIFPVFILNSGSGGDEIIFSFPNDGNRIRYMVGNGGWQSVNNVEFTTSNGVSTALFDPITFSDQGISFTIDKLYRSAGRDDENYRQEDNAMQVAASGTYIPLFTYTKSFDKRKVKLKGPGATGYTEINASGNSVLFPHEELSEMYVGYSDVTDYVRSHGMGEYTVADVALAEGWGDRTGFYGHWGLVVVYQNSKMHWRDVTVFDGYSFVQSLDEQEYVGEIEIDGFGAVKQGPVDLKLGVMAGEGDRSIEGDFLEIINQKGVWVPLQHPLTSKSNFFNSSIYTPVRNAAGGLVENPRNPRLSNNTGIDIVQWDVPNPENTIIANEQTSTRFRFGSKQDVYNIYAFALSVRSYAPDIQVVNKIESIHSEAPGEDPSVKPGEEIVYNLELRNKGEEAVEQTRIVIPIPYTAVFVDARTIPDGYGKVTFDPNQGIAGSIIWEIGDIPLLDDPSDVVATLQYTLKVTEDCFVLANDNCEATVAVNGTISGIGSISESAFSNLPFNQAGVEGDCSGGQVNHPSEIPITGRAEFAQSRCAGYELFSGLGDITLPEFCQRDAPVDLLSLISPSKEDYSLFFFTQETGGSPLFNYQVNTAIAGTEQIWVSEGPAGSCTGFRVPVTIYVSPVAPEPQAYDKTVCSYSDELNFEVAPTAEGYQLRYYPDNNPLSKPMQTVPKAKGNVAGESAVWVSQYKEGECESPRRKVIVMLQDCPGIEVSITPDVEVYHTEGQVVTYTLVVENIGKTPLTNVGVSENLTHGTWVVPILQPAEKKTFTTTYVITSSDMLYKMVSNSVYAGGADKDGVFVSDYKYVDIISFTPGFLDYAISLLDVSCSVGGDELGSLTINFQKGAQTGSYELVRLDDGQLFSGYYDNAKSVRIEIPSGEYALTLFDGGAFPHVVPGIHQVEGSASVDYTVPEEITACVWYDFFPTTEKALNFTLRGPNGSIVGLKSEGFYELHATGTYTITGTDPSGIRCPVQKTFQAIINQPSELDLEVLPFCSGDIFTTVQLLNPVDGYSAKWYKLDADGQIHLSEYDNSTTLTTQEEGEYELTLMDGEGCIRGKGRVQVVRSPDLAPQLNKLYTICPTGDSRVSLAAGSQFVASKWYLDGIEVSNALHFVPDQAGSYSLVATDQNGCESFADFEVEVKCEPTIRYPNAIVPGVPDKAFIIYPDNLIGELEVFVQNRWGEMIYHCKDKNLQFGKTSACIWDGTVNQKTVPNGNYHVTIRYKIKENGLVLTEKGVVNVVE